MSEVGGARAANNGGRGAAGPIPVPVPPQPQTTTPPPPHGSGTPGVRTPREIMKERQEREARRRAEAEAAERQREEERRRRSAEQRLAAVGGQMGGNGPRTSTGGGYTSNVAPRYPTGPSAPTGPTSLGPPPSLQPPISQAPQDPAAMNSRRTAPAQSSRQPQPVSTQQPAPGPSRTTQPLPTQRPTAGPSQQPQAAPRSEQPSSQTGGTTNTFPHAFERWETLSSHWEGLTSYWLHRLEANESELRAQPLAAQMSRQIADLSAAGANLFHAVVELQRLRASSERKFQRWFFDTRAEQERSRETIAELERNLRAEREAKKHLERNSGEKVERDRRNSERIVQETRRELKIAKEEARRAWEELGRREQEERERTMSLREGLPTIVGGVQVVPMMAGMGVSQSQAESVSVSHAPSQTGQSATYAEQTDPFVETAPEQTPAQSRGYPSTSTPATEGSASTARPGQYSQQMSPQRQEQSYPSPTEAAIAATQHQPFYSHPDQYINPGSPPYSQASATMPPHSNGHIAPTSAPAPPPTYPRHEDDTSIVSDEGDEYIRQAQAGQHHRHESTGTASDEYDVQAEIDRERALAERYGIQPPTQQSSAQVQPLRGGGGYSGQGYEYGGFGEGDDDEDGDPEEEGPYTGAGYSGWESMRTHHHPTRLSDVIEEDERSRTSPSRASQASRGLF